MLRHSHQRAGFSLTEVMVATFVMAMGIICLLTLFPVGAVQMGRALRDDRAQTMCALADGPTTFGLPVNEDYFLGLDRAGFNPIEHFGIGQPGYEGFRYVSPLSARPSFPVLYDPIGMGSYYVPIPDMLPLDSQNNKRDTIAMKGDFPRRASRIYYPDLNNSIPPPRLPTLFSNSYRLNWAIAHWTMPDDLTFGTNAFPANADGNLPVIGQPIIRQGRFNSAVVIQRTENAKRITADIKILVFDRRAPGVNSTSNEKVVSSATGPTKLTNPPTTLPDPDPLVDGELSPAKIASGLTQLTFTGTGFGFRFGSWLMDGSIADLNRQADGSPPTPASIANPRPPQIRTANFYRIISVNEDAPTNTTTVDIETPWKAPTCDVPFAGNARYSPTIYFFSELIEVFERPPLMPSLYSPAGP